MREIKFRAWDTSKNRFLQVDEVDECPNDNIFINGYIDQKKYGVGLSIESEFVEFNLYAGLKDKNGKDVYEGDVLEITCKFPLRKGVEIQGVEWLDSHASFGTDEWLMCEFVENIRNGEQEVEVIGNIYENPELLTS